MGNQLHRYPHCVYSIKYYLVWILRYCKKVLGGPNADRLKMLLGEIASQYVFATLHVAVEVLPDPVHLFVSAPPEFSPTEGVRYFRRTAGSHGIMSRQLKQESA